MASTQSPQTVIVTGASSGIGQAIAIAFGKQGSNVVINYHSDQDGAEQTLQQIESGGGRGLVVKADVGDEKAVIAMFETCMARFGGIDVLVCNAGLQRDNSFSAMTLEEWQQVINTNLTGQFLCARQAIRYFESKPAADIDQPAIGNIIFMSSVHDIIPWSGHVNYASSKGGVLMLMKSLALEVAPKKIRINGISPGAIATDINKEVWSDPASKKELLKLIPYKRIGKSEDVARVALWLASHDSDYVTGTTIYVDGGMTLYPGFEDNG
jgi:glucose 1-dehydrogenase